MESFFERLKEYVKSRIFIMFCAIIALFSVLIGRLYYLQILHGEESQQSLKLSVTRELSIPASRGSIYDRYGRPLAVNDVAFSVKLDDNNIKIELPGRNSLTAELVKELEEKGEVVADTLPITKTKPYQFTFSTEEEKLWKTSIGLKGKQLKMTADDVMEYLLDKYELESDTDFNRKVISTDIYMNDKNLMLLRLINIFDENGETIMDEIPISSEEPYTFLFNNNKSREENWKRNDISMSEEQLGYSAAETIDYLSDLFGIPDNLSNKTKRKLIALRYPLYLQRFKKYQPVTIALDISGKTVASLEENQDMFPGVTIGTDSLRVYPQGQYMSHILGTIRKISDSEYKEFQQKGYTDLYGYTNTDIIGKSGVELAKEIELNGVDGPKLVEVDNMGRTINTVETQQPISGKDVFLTIDQDLQKAAYNYLEQELINAIKLRLTTSSAKQLPVNIKTLFSSMVMANSISLEKIMKAEEGQQIEIKNVVLNALPEFDISSEEHTDIAKQLIVEAIENSTISTKQMLITLYEQGLITADEQYLNCVENNTASVLSVILHKLDIREILPHHTNLDPCTGSVVVSDVNTGEALALVTYPSYDNNRLVNNFDNDYYNMLMNDPNTPMINRPTNQKKAPGSTFKMVTAIAALETGIIKPNSVVRTLGIYTAAGAPYARCWLYTSGGGNHGPLTVEHALEVSCNYFFYEMGYRMGNKTDGGTLRAITTLNEYMDAFGLNSVTGIEIGESPPNMASPAYKERVTKTQNPEATVSQTRWNDGDTIRAAIGQSVNNFAPIHMNKYIATLANGGTRYKMHIISKLDNPDGSQYEVVEPEVENILQLKEENLEVVHNGMLLVTKGSRGTLRKVFSDFPIDTAGKSGTAQEDLTRSSHTWFVGFAPFDSPQISVTVMIPFGEYSNSPEATVARNIIGEYMGLNYEAEGGFLENSLLN